ncbi:MAG: hypothetical protein ABW195_08030 [Ilumatobacteraceae bacterium]
MVRAPDWKIAVAFSAIGDGVGVEALALALDALLTPVRPQARDRLVDQEPPAGADGAGDLGRTQQPVPGAGRLGRSAPLTGWCALNGACHLGFSR